MMLLLLAPLAAAPRAPPQPDVWYSPHFDFPTPATPASFFRLLDEPETAWPELARRASYFKLKMRLINPGSATDAELKGLIATLKRLKYKVGIEIAGARVSATILQPR